MFRLVDLVGPLIYSHISFEENGCWIWTGPSWKGKPTVNFPAFHGSDVPSTHRVTGVWHILITGLPLKKGPHSLPLHARLGRSWTTETTCGNSMCVSLFHLVRVNRYGPRQPVPFMALGRMYAQVRYDMSWCAHGHFRSPENIGIKEVYGQKRLYCVECDRRWKKTNRQRKPRPSRSAIVPSKDWTVLAKDYLESV